MPLLMIKDHALVADANLIQKGNTIYYTGENKGTN